MMGWGFCKKEGKENWEELGKVHIFSSGWEMNYKISKNDQSAEASVLSSSMISIFAGVRLTSPCEVLLPLLLAIPSVLIRDDISIPLNEAFSTATTFFYKQLFQMLLTRLSLTAGRRTLLPSSSLEGLFCVSLAQTQSYLLVISMVLFLQCKKMRFFCSCSCLFVAKTSSTLSGACFSLYFWKVQTLALMQFSSSAIQGSNSPLTLLFRSLEDGKFSFSEYFNLINVLALILNYIPQIAQEKEPNQNVSPTFIFSLKLHNYFKTNTAMQSNTQSFSQPRIEDSILFDVNEQTLLDMNLTEHISRLQQMSRFLGDALNKNRSNLLDLRELVKGQIANLKNNTQILQSNIRDETTQLKSLFEPTIAAEIKKINELKTDVGKINAEQLTTKKFLLNLEASISHCETEIGFREYKR